MSRTIQSADVSHKFHPLDKVVPGAYAYISTATDVDTAVVFVHGFQGDATTTWERFQSMISSHLEGYPEWKSSDAYFYTYSDTLESIDDSAEKLQAFLDSVFPSISQSVGTLLGFQSKYSHLVLVGHSEGGVVIRAVIAYAGSKWIKGGNRSPALDARLSLFAPAHMGFVPTSWLGALASVTGIRQLANIAIGFSTPATEMHDKTVLLQLQNTTYELWREHKDVQAFSAHVLFGSKEHIVLRGYYLQDCRHRPERGKSHKAVCKPSSSYPRPLGFVRGDCPQ